MHTLATQADTTSHGRAAQAAPAPRAATVGPLQASLALPSVGVTVSISPQAVQAAAGLVKLGSEGAQLLGDAAHAVGDAAGSVLQGGIAAALVGAALLG